MTLQISNNLLLKKKYPPVDKAMNIFVVSSSISNVFRLKFNYYILLFRMYTLKLNVLIKNLVSLFCQQMFNNKISILCGC